jgi:hypothetical protein
VNAYNLFSSPVHAVSEAADKINDRWGEFVITPALMLGMEDIILDRISFRGVKELQEIYEWMGLCLDKPRQNIVYPSRE